MNSKQLKIIALLSMFYDHITRIISEVDLLLPLAEVLEMRYPEHSGLISSLFIEILPSALAYIGRLAAPIFMFLISVGFYKTKDVKKYMFRIFIFAIISQIPYIAFDQTQGFVAGMADAQIEPFFQVNLNMMFSLSLGLLTIYVFEILKEKHALPAFLFVLVSGLFADLVHTEGSMRYVFMIFVFHLLRNTSTKKKAFLWLLLLPIINYKLWSYVIVEHEMGFLKTAILNTFGVYLGIALTFFFNGEKGNISKTFQYATYWFYPVHLAVLSLIAMAMTGRFGLIF